jgi:hypothetical protein
MSDLCVFHRGQFTIKSIVLVASVAAFVVGFDNKMSGMVKRRKNAISSCGAMEGLSPKPSRINKSCTRFQICETMILN